MLIMPVNTANVSANRYILPGIAQSTGNSNWRSDVRLLNAGTSAVPATITYYEQGNAEPRSVTRTVNPAPFNVVRALATGYPSTFGTSVWRGPVQGPVHPRQMLR